MPKKLEDAAIDAWIATHPGWDRVHEKALAREFKFKDFAGALAFVVKLGAAAEKKNHHPDLELGWGRAKATWSTHDAGGVTQLDLEMAETTDALAAPK
jgi:4a-hydroxytetrahydrobiopterin dehydratase